MTLSPPLPSFRLDGKTALITGGSISGVEISDARGYGSNPPQLLHIQRVARRHVSRQHKKGNYGLGSTFLCDHTIEGAADYLPEPLEPPATGNVLICCSRPRGDLEIDL